MTSPPRRWLLLLNHVAGGGDEDPRPAIEAAMAACGDSWENLDVPEGGSGADMLRDTSQAFDALLVAGGDGTVMEAVNGLMRREERVPMAIVPTGTANFVARALEVPTDVEDALEVALKGSPRKIDVGRCDERFFLLGIGLGLAERFVTTTEEAEKKRLGPWAYLLSLVREMRSPQATFVAEFEGGERASWRGSAMVVANAAGLGHGKVLSEKVRPDDGHLDAIVLHRVNLWKGLRLAWRIGFGEITQDPEVTHRTVVKARIHSEPPVPIQIDGDAVEQTTPVEIEIFPGNLTVFMRKSGQ